MFFNRQTSLRLHEEHLATVQLWGRLDQAIASRLADEEILSLCRQCVAALADEVARHFEFEERELFTRLSQAGDGDIAALLAEEHETIRRAAAAFEVEMKSATGLTPPQLPAPDVGLRRLGPRQVVLAVHRLRRVDSGRSTRTAC